MGDLELLDKNTGVMWAKDDLWALKEWEQKHLVQPKEYEKDEEGNDKRDENGYFIEKEVPKSALMEAAEARVEAAENALQAERNAEWEKECEEEKEEADDELDINGELYKAQEGRPEEEAKEINEAFDPDFGFDEAKEEKEGAAEGQEEEAQDNQKEGGGDAGDWWQEDKEKKDEGKEGGEGGYGDNDEWYQDDEGNWKKKGEEGGDVNAYGNWANTDEGPVGNEAQGSTYPAVTNTDVNMDEI